MRGSPKQIPIRMGNGTIIGVHPSHVLPRFVALARKASYDSKRTLTEQLGAHVTQLASEVEGQRIAVEDGEHGARSEFRVAASEYRLLKRGLRVGCTIAGTLLCYWLVSFVIRRTSSCRERGINALVVGGIATGIMVAFLAFQLFGLGGATLLVAPPNRKELQAEPVPLR